MPWRLAVVGQDDEPVRARRVSATAAIRASWRSTRRSVAASRAARSRVVGDLVVGQERRVGDGPAGVHVGDHGLDLEVALDHRRARANDRVDEAPVDARLHVGAPLLRGDPRSLAISAATRSACA